MVLSAAVCSGLQTSIMCGRELSSRIGYLNPHASEKLISIEGSASASSLCIAVLWSLTTTLNCVINDTLAVSL